MKSVKPGRGPSAMGALGSVVMAVVGLLWTIMASSMGAPGIFPLFGVLFIIIAVVNGIYNYKNATGKNRYSTFDITEDGEETDPLQQRFGQLHVNDDTRASSPGASFCPYCGEPAQTDYEFCSKCGKRLP